MEKQKVIEVNNVSKKYRLGQMGYRTLRDDIANLFRRKKEDEGSFWALKNVSFDLGKGESLGIIGANGAGKSTILKILAGVVKPTSGMMSIKGKVGALIELSAGFHPELTGRENIYLYGSIIGLKKNYIDRRFDEIVEFSGLSQFLDTPIKKYSSGMFARLGFSVTAHLDPDILLIDEVLSVGDFNFQNKCVNKMLEYINNNVSIVFISHNLESVKKLCDRTILLDKGIVVKDGDTESAIDEYYKINSKTMKEKKSDEAIVRVEESKFLNKNAEQAFDFQSGDKALFKIKLFFKKDISGASFSIFLRRNDGMVIFDVSSSRLNDKKYDFASNQTVEVCYELKLNLLKGVYHLGFNLVGSVDGGPESFIEYVNNISSFLIKESISEQGVVNMDPKCSVEILGR